VASVGKKPGRGRLFRGNPFGCGALTQAVEDFDLADLTPEDLTPEDLTPEDLTPEDLAALRRAVQSLEHPGFAARLANMVGKPIELIGRVLPASASHAIATATSKGLEVALKVALRTMQRTPYAGSQLLHKALATASGAAGGAFGLATLPIELPVSTIIMLRSIADIARSEGEDLSRNRHSHACRSLHWADGLARTMRPKADISPYGACSRRA
jgi:hypothetical protein